MTLAITLSLIVGSIILGLATLVVYYARRYQRQLSKAELYKEENETLVKQITSIVYTKSDAARVFRELRDKYEDS